MLRKNAKNLCIICFLFLAELSNIKFLAKMNNAKNIKSNIQISCEAI